MAWGRGGGGKFFRVEERVREHSCLPAQVSTPDIQPGAYSVFIDVLLQRNNER